MLLLQVYAIVGFLLTLTHGFYLPGVAPTTYGKFDSIPMLVNHITPSLSHGDSNSKTYVYSYDYYFPRFHFCTPEGGAKKQSESLGSIIFGDRIFNSPFTINMLENKTCEKLCESVYSKTDSVFVNRNIRAGFQHNWIIDGLPVARDTTDLKTNTEFYGAGFPLGVVEDSALYLTNHYEIFIEYHERGPNQYRVVGATINPYSIKREGEEFKCDLENSMKVKLDQGKDTKVAFSYSVYFIESETAWLTRWDKYLHVYDPKIQWFSLINFSIIVVLLSFIMSHVLLKTLKNDIAKYNEVNLDDDLVDEMGWKLVHGDVLRTPKNRMIFSILIGSGVQLFIMSIVTMVFLLFGLLSPSNRGSLATVMFLLYLLFGFIGSFISSYLYKFFNGDNWKLNMILTPLVVPGSLFFIFIFLNFFLISVSSSGAVPIGTMFAIIFIWFLISIPLSVLGSLLAYRRPLPTLSIKVNQIPRQIPRQPWYLRTIPLSLIAGIFPFGSIAIEMYFIYNSIWFNRIYYMFGFLFFCFVLMIITTVLMTILLIYYTLCNENYRWQWKSFFIGGGVSIYIFIHALWLSKFQLGGFSSFILYTGYSTVISLLVGLCCGSIGFIGSLIFIYSIYNSIKID